MDSSVEGDARSDEGDVREPVPMIAVGIGGGMGSGGAIRLRAAEIPNFEAHRHVVDESCGLLLVNRYQI
jgi:hypothetical protein